MRDVYWYWLCNIKGIGRKRIYYLLEEFRTPDNVYNATHKELFGIKTLTPKEKALVEQSRSTWDLKEEYVKLSKLGITFISIEHPDYPTKLKAISDYPYGIYVKGQLPCNNRPSVAIIVARMCSSYGSYMAAEFGRELARYGVQVVSGMAKGIDGIGQKSALEMGGNTYAVLGCGVDICYPRHNIDLYMDIQQNGGILSELPIGSNPLSKYFPMRNRIISGLSDIVLVIEAKEKSGSLITADMALEQGKDVFVLPGRVDDNLSKGCNTLIKQGAGIVVSVEDFIQELGLCCQIYNEDYKMKDEHNIDSLKYGNYMSEAAHVIYCQMGYHDKSLHTILAETGLQLQDVLEELLLLELKGYITETSKNHYARIK